MDLTVTKFHEDWLKSFEDIQQNPQGGILPPPKSVQIRLKNN